MSDDGKRDDDAGDGDRNGVDDAMRAIAWCVNTVNALIVLSIAAYCHRARSRKR